MVHLLRIVDNIEMPMKKKKEHIHNYSLTKMNDKTVEYKHLIEIIKLRRNNVPECSNKHVLACHLESLEGI